MKTPERMTLIGVWISFDVGDSDHFDRETSSKVDPRGIVILSARDMDHKERRSYAK